jgi:hypothetical protein
MMERRTRQPGLFDAPVLPMKLPALQRAKALALLGALLTEAVAVRTEDALVQSREVGDDADHG